MKAKIILTLCLASLFLLSCNKWENETESGSKLILVSLQGVNLENQKSNIAYSDVITSSGGIFDDVGTATMITVLIDSADTSPTAYQDVLVDQIDVKFFRTDGRNVEGVDVPYSFRQPMAQLVPVGTQVEIPFVIIRHVAKLEPPLVALFEDWNRDIVLQLVAQVTIHGKDAAGFRVQPVTQNITVWCSNFADEN